MKAIGKAIKALNKLVLDPKSNPTEFVKLLEKLRIEYKLKFILIDVEKHNEEKMLEYTREKLVAVKRQDFEGAAVNRTKERECIDYLDLVTSLNITCSQFTYEDAYLFFFYFGNTDEEKALKEIFTAYLNKR